MVERRTDGRMCILHRIVQYSRLHDADVCDAGGREKICHCLYDQFSACCLLDGPCARRALNEEGQEAHDGVIDTAASALHCDCDFARSIQASDKGRGWWTYYGV